MELIEVNSAALAKDFRNVNVLMNAGDPAYIRPLDKEVDAVFDTNSNKALAHSEVIRWVLKNEKGGLIGRIAAFTNSKYINKGTSFPTGGFGYFDCINDNRAACILFNAAKQWLEQKGMEAMDGPINLGSRDKNWGLLIEGFGKEPIYGLAYNPPYYQNLFEHYGFKNYYNQYYYTMQVDDVLPNKFRERYERFAAKPDYSVNHANLKHLEKYANDFATVYNSAWAQHGESKTITVEEAIALFKTMKAVIDERMVWFAYYKGEAIGMFINIPDVNQYFKYFNGKLGLIQKLQLVWMKYRGTCKKLVGLAFGVVPKYQALGIDSYMIYASALVVQGKGWYKEYEMGWAGDWNPIMINIYKSLGGIQSRHLVTYRHIFNNQHPFERHPVLEYK